MQTSQSDGQNISTNSPSFPLSKTSPSLISPFLADRLHVQENQNMVFAAACYSPKHNLIIACPEKNDDYNYTIQFYDARTLSYFKGREETQELMSFSARTVSFHPKTDRFLLECVGGLLYMYNASTDELKMLKKYGEKMLTAIFLDSSYYVFSCFRSRKLFLGTLENESVMSFDSHNSDPFCLQHVPERNLLICGLMNDSVMIYWTDKLPNVKVFCSVQGHLRGIVMVTAQRIIIGRKEYMITAGEDRTVKIWHLVKGRMRLLKVIWTQEIPHSVVYLEKYKMLAIASDYNYVKFLRLPSGKLEKTVYLAGGYLHRLFLMDKENMIGVINSYNNLIEFIQLEGGGGVQEGERILEEEEKN